MEAVYIAPGQGEQQGPYSADQVRTMWQQGQIPSGALFWSQGMGDWRPIHEMPGLAPLPQLGQSNMVLGYTAANRHTYTYEMGRITRIVTNLLWIGLVIGVLSSLGDVWELSAGSASANSDDMQPVDWYQLLVGLPQLGFFIATVVAFSKWIYRADANVHGFGAQALEYTPAWAVGYYFVPFANLYKPFQAMKEIWQASRDPDNWGVQTPPALLSAWWGLWLLSNFIGQATMRAAMNSDPSVARFGIMLSIASGLVDIPLSLVAMRMIQQIYGLQEEWVHRKQQ